MKWDGGEGRKMRWDRWDERRWDEIDEMIWEMSWDDMRERWDERDVKINSK